MPERIEKRLVIALPIRVYGMGSDGKPFNQEARTLDITREGARIDGLPQIAAGETIGVQYGEAKKRYKVVWVGEAGGSKEGQIGVQVVEPGPSVWHKVLDATPEEARWVPPPTTSSPTSTAVVPEVSPVAQPISAVVQKPQAERPTAAPAPKTPTSEPPAPANAISQRVEGATDELQAIEKLIESGAVDGRILQDFREAVNHVRQTSWAVQRWLELRDKKQDPYSAVDLLVRERVRCATQLVRELGHDVESSEVDIETEGLAQLQTQVDTLWKILARIMGKAKS
jgi:hypothetical protein